MSNDSGPFAPRPPHSGGAYPNQRTPSLENAPFDPVEALKWAFEVYRRDVARVVAPIAAFELAILFVSWIGPNLLGFIVRAALITAPSGARSAIASGVQYTVGSVLGLVGAAYAVSSLYPYLLQLARGHSVEITDAFRPGRSFVNALILMVLLSLATSIGLSLCLLPGLAIMIACSTAFPALADRNLDALTTIRECIDHAQRHFLPILSFGVLCIVITLIGSAACLVGAVVVSVPLVMLGQVYVYLRLRGETPVGAA